ncbi:cytochrome c oxidase subunit II [Alkalimonas sp.]|uniref:cytochrome c oxidase subunit II n=1 Tax=Alkalimonas sp. TaxID=1872453 RepID=UPI00263B4CFB|nr:cytochrome c oxidase subunit II [Alkalimonas sp.]MCC5826688.1 cytochrome c oxidase subunit II [Alkalimonas sp.]
MAIAIIILLLIIGTVIFHFISPWYFTPLASNWSAIDNTVELTFWITGFVFVAVNLFLVYVLFRYRSRPGLKAEYEPENKKLEGWLTLATTIGIAAMLAPGLYVWGQFVKPPDNAMQVEAVGQQWHWSYRFPGEDGVLGKVDTRLVSENNPFGIDPSDPAGQDDILIFSNELVLPLEQPVKMLLRSKDVLHNFTVPQFRVKMDMVPGISSFLWFTPTRTGVFDLMCEELCGIGHYAMRGRVVVKEPDEFERWLARQVTFAQTQSRTAGDAALGRAQYMVCAACHGTQGEGNEGLHAPRLAGQDLWYLQRQLKNYQQGVRGTTEGDVFGGQMIAMANLVSDEQSMQHLLAYIGSLPEPVRAKADGDLRRGQQLYRNCVHCHGEQAEGSFHMNAPRLAGLEPWYLSRQIVYFRDRVRGGHPDDFYGAQMSLLVQSLRTEEDIDDLVAYINSLQPAQLARRD